MSPLSLSTWSLIFPLGMALLVHERMPHDVGAFGLLVAGYGVGNFLATLVCGSLPIRRPFAVVCLGLGLAGAGFIAMALAPTFLTMSVAAAVAAAGGPMYGLNFMSLLQQSGDRHYLARMFRLSISIDNGGKVLMFVASPWLFSAFGVEPVIMLAGGAMIAICVAGLVLDNVLSDPQGSSE